MAGVFQTFERNGKAHARWRFYYRDHRGIIRKASGTTSKAETERMAASAQAREDEIRRGWRPAPKTSDTPHAIEQIAADYILWGKSQGGRNGRPWSALHAEKRESSLKWWMEKLNLTLVSDLVGVLPRIEKELRSLKVSGRTKNHRFDALSAFCSWAEQRGYLDADPLKGFVPFDNTPKTRRRAYTAEEIQRLLTTCNPDYRLGYQLALASGLRYGELRALRVRHLSVERCGVLLEAEFTKNRKNGFQPLPVALVEALSSASQGKDGDADLIRLPVNPHTFPKELKRAGISKDSPIGKLDFHAFRTTYITLLDMAGASVAECQGLARHHSPILTYGVYAKTSKDRLQSVAERLWEIVQPMPTECQRQVACGEMALGTRSYNGGQGGIRTPG